MFGTAASLAGIQNRLIASMRNWATNSQTRLSTSGIETKNPNRRRSATTIVLRRSNRSANAPASGPSTMAGSSRNSSTAPSAKFLPAKLSTSEVAVAVMASSPSQSPKLDSAIDSQSLRKSRTRRTARIFATRPTAPISSPGCSSVSGARASAGTGVPPEGRPSGGTAVRSSGCEAGPSTGGCAGRGGSDLIGAPGSEGGGWSRPLGHAHGTGRGRRFPALSVNGRRPSVGSIRGLGSRDVPAVLRRARPPVRRAARPGAGSGAVGRGGPGLRGGRAHRLAGRALARGTDHRRRLLPRDARRRGRPRGSGPRVVRRRRRPRLGAVRAGRRPGEQRRPALGAGARAAAGPLGGGTGTGRRAGRAGAGQLPRADARPARAAVRLPALGRPGRRRRAAAGRRREAGGLLRRAHRRGSGRRRVGDDVPARADRRGPGAGLGARHRAAAGAGPAGRGRGGRADRGVRGRATGGLPTPAGRDDGAAVPPRVRRGPPGQLNRSRCAAVTYGRSSRVRPRVSGWVASRSWTRPRNLSRVSWSMVAA